MNMSIELYVLRVESYKIGGGPNETLLGRGPARYEEVADEPIRVFSGRPEHNLSMHLCIQTSENVAAARGEGFQARGYFMQVVVPEIETDGQTGRKKWGEFLVEDPTQLTS